MLRLTRTSGTQIRSGWVSLVVGRCVPAGVEEMLLLRHVLATSTIGIVGATMRIHEGIPASTTSVRGQKLAFPPPVRRHKSKRHRCTRFQRSASLGDGGHCRWFVARRLPRDSMVDGRLRTCRGSSDEGGEEEDGQISFRLATARAFVNTCKPRVDTCATSCCFHPKQIGDSGMARYTTLS